MVTKALLNVSIEGLGAHRKTSVFPCGIFQYKKGINDKPGTPNYDLKRLALKSTAQRLYPNYANCDWSSQVAWLKADRKMKEEVIAELDSETKEKLIDAIKNNPSIGKKLCLILNENELQIDYEERPEEMFSTMGKRKL